MKLSSLFKNTIFYGVITILPRVLNLILTPLHIDNFLKSEYGIYQGIFAYLILGNVFLTYGMETAFFRFANKENNSKKVESTALASLFITTFVAILGAWFFKEMISGWINYPQEFVAYALLILGIDTLCVIPFAWLRNRGKSLKYALLKLLNISVNLLLNLFFFLALPSLLKENQLWQLAQAPNKIHYVFIANLVASLVTLFAFLPLIFRIGFRFDFSLWKKMFRYAFPIFIAGIAFSINEAFDRIFIRMFFDETSADEMVGVYAACYKMGVFMTLFITAYKLGVEPFFFREATDKNAPKTYAKITEFFSISSASILLIVSVYIDIFKRILIPNSLYWEALWIVPLILLANLCLGIYHSLSVWYKVTDRTHYGAYISVIGALVTIGSNLLFVPTMGYRGAALATLLAYATMMLLSLFLGQKKYPIPYNFKTIGLFLGGSIGLSFLNFYAFEKNIYSGTLFVLLYATAFGFYVKRNFFQKQK